VKRALLLPAIVLAISLGAVATQVCPVDKTVMTATGETRQEDGKTLAEYRCEKGHVYWIAVD